MHPEPLERELELVTQAAPHQPHGQDRLEPPVSLVTQEPQAMPARVLRPVDLVVQLLRRGQILQVRLVPLVLQALQVLLVILGQPVMLEIQAEAHYSHLVVLRFLFSLEDPVVLWELLELVA